MRVRVKFTILQVAFKTAKIAYFHSIFCEQKWKAAAFEQCIYAHLIYVEGR